MSALKSRRGRAAPARLSPFFFWIVRDRSPQMRKIGSLLSVIVPLEKHVDVLGTDFEDWCFESLQQGVLAEWRGLDLIFHFATVKDALLFKLTWF
jgi:hypothetical protein